MPSINKNPYLSIVIASRNDDHGGNMLQRMQASFNGLLEQLEKYRIESELILVDWNPPTSKPSLKEVINFPDGLKYCTIRFIEVSSAIHRKLSYSDRLPFYVIEAVNCGIRRARGKFVLSGVMDLLYSDEVMSFISAKSLKENERYRANRCDVNKGVLEQATFKKQLEHCQKNVIKVHRYDPRYCYEGLPSLHTDACGDFQLMSKSFWHLLRGYREGDIIPKYTDGLLSYASYAAGVKEIVLADKMCIYHIDHGGKFNDRKEVKRPIIEQLLALFFKPVRLFLPVFISKKIVFWGQKLIGRKSKKRTAGIPTLDWLEYLDLARNIVSGKCPYIFNDENWGLAKENLPEFIVNRAFWDKKQTI